MSYKRKSEPHTGGHSQFNQWWLYLGSRSLSLSLSVSLSHPQSATTSICRVGFAVYWQLDSLIRFFDHQFWQDRMDIVTDNPRNLGHFHRVQAFLFITINQGKRKNWKAVFSYYLGQSHPEVSQEVLCEGFQLPSLNQFRYFSNSSPSLMINFHSRIGKLGNGSFWFDLMFLFRTFDLGFFWIWILVLEGYMKICCKWVGGLKVLRNVSYDWYFLWEFYFFLSNVQVLLIVL